MTENEAKQIIIQSQGCCGKTCNHCKKAHDLAIQTLEEIQAYRELEQKLQSVYGEHEGLLEIIVNGLIKYEHAPNGAIKTVLLTDDDVDKWETFKTIHMPGNKIFLEKRFERSFMLTINITNARKDLYNLVESVGLNHEPALIVGKKANAVLVSEEDWNAMQETLYLNSIPGMSQSILDGVKESINNCVPEEMVSR